MPLRYYCRSVEAIYLEAELQQKFTIIALIPRLRINECKLSISMLAHASHVLDGARRENVIKIFKNLRTMLLDVNMNSIE